MVLGHISWLDGADSKVSHCMDHLIIFFKLFVSPYFRADSKVSNRVDNLIKWCNYFEVEPMFSVFTEEAFLLLKGKNLKFYN